MEETPDIEYLSLIVGVPCYLFNSDFRHLPPLSGRCRLDCRPSSSQKVLIHADPVHLRLSQCYVSLTRHPLPWDGTIPDDAVSIIDSVEYGAKADRTACVLSLPADHFMLTSTTSTMDEEVSTCDSIESNINEVAFSLYFVYDAKINDQPEGLYRVQNRPLWDTDSWESDVIDGDTYFCPKPPIVLATASELLYSRRVFPCADFPTHKMRSQMSIVINFCEVHKGLSVCSTTDQLENEELNSEVIPRLFRAPSSPSSGETSSLAYHTCTPGTTGYKVFCFKPTPRLAPYSLSFFVSVFERDFRQLPTARIECCLPVAQPSRIPLCQWTLTWATKVFHHLQMRVFSDFKLNTDKITLIPLRNQRGLALENHCVITFKEDLFYLDESSELSRIFRVCRVVVHELIHQWLGNTYTPDEMTEVWLKEGVVRYLEFVILYEMFNEKDEILKWHWFVSFLMDCKIEALIIDTYRDKIPSPGKSDIQLTPRCTSRLSELPWSCCGAADSPRRIIGTAQNIPPGSRPIRPAADPPLSHDDILLLYDSVTYNKAAVILFMYDSAVRYQTDYTGRGFWADTIINTLSHHEVKISLLFNASHVFDAGQEILSNLNVKPLPSQIKLEDQLINILDLNPRTFMTPWLEQAGYPIIYYKVFPCESIWRIEIEQIPNRYARHEEDRNPFLENPETCVWPIPLTLILHCEDRLEIPFVLVEKKMTISLKCPGLKAMTLGDGSDYGYFIFSCRSPSFSKCPIWNFASRALSESIGLITRNQSDPILQKLASSHNVASTRVRLSRLWSLNLSRLQSQHDDQAYHLALMKNLECRSSDHHSECPCTTHHQVVVDVENRLRSALLELGNSPEWTRQQCHVSECWYDEHKANWVTRTWAEWICFGWPLKA